MEIVVNDANILFDLIGINLTEYFFQLKYKFITTDLVINEIKNKDEISLISRCISNRTLIVYSINNIEKIFNEKEKNPKLSSEDCSVLITAKEQNAMILTGDNALRKVAKEEKIKVHGILWIFDELLKITLFHMI